MVLVKREQENNNYQCTAGILHFTGWFQDVLRDSTHCCQLESKGDEFSLILDQNPLTDHPQLQYSNIVCGVIRSALEMVSHWNHGYHTQTYNKLSLQVGSLIPRPMLFSVA